MQVYLVETTGYTIIRNWTGTGRDSEPFYGWAMYVDHMRDMYISDRPKQGEKLYGRVTKLAVNGTELGEWTRKDGVAYSLTSIAYVDSTAGGACAYWMADSEKGVVRVAADGRLLLPFYKAPVDLADNRTARFTGMDTDVDVNFHAVLVLLDTSDPSTTKLWRFSTASHNYTLLNTYTARLGRNIKGIAVNTTSHDIYLTDTLTRKVIRIHADGELDTMFSTRSIEFEEPVDLVVNHANSTLYVVDTTFDGDGSILLFDMASHTAIAINISQRFLWRPLSITLDTMRQSLFVADSNGAVVQLDVESLRVQSVSQPVPAAFNVHSMTVSSGGNVYLVDTLSRRLIVLMAAPAGFDWGDSCSSSASSMSSPDSDHSTAVLVSVIIIGVVTVVLGASGVFIWWRKRRQRNAGSHSMQMEERLLPAGDGENWSESLWRVNELQHSEAGCDSRGPTEHCHCREVRLAGHANRHR